MKLERHLKSRGISLGIFAGRIGVSPPAVHRYVKGERIPRPAIMQRIIRESDGEVQAADFYTAGEATAQ